MVKTAIWLAGLLVFLTPLKISGIIGVPEIVFLPDGFESWFAFSLPVPFLGLATAALLLLTLVSCPMRLSIYNKYIIYAVALLTALSMPGFISCSVLDFGIHQICLLSSVLCGVLAIGILLGGQEKELARKVIGGAIVAGFVFVLLQGVHQKIWGFENTLDYIKSLESQGYTFSQNLRGRLESQRVFSAFTLCNSFAAYVLLAGPIGLYLLLSSPVIQKLTFLICLTTGLYFVCFGYTAFTVPAAIIYLILVYDIIIDRGGVALRWASAGLLISLCVLNLLWTGSRAGLLSMAIVSCAVPFCCRIWWRYKVAYALVIIALSISAYIFIQNGRNFDSLIVRYDYCRVAVQLLAEHPLVGVGWGDFFHEYPALKTFDGNEAPHDPHCFPLTYAQAGLLPVLVALALCILPIYCWWREGRPSGMPAFITFAWAAFVLHSMLDVNFQVPSLFLLGIVILLLYPSEKTTLLSDKWKYLASVCALATALICAHRITADYAFRPLYSLTENPKARLEVSDIDKLLNRNRQVAPYSPFPYACAGAYYQRIGNHPEAEKAYAEAVRLSPYRASYHHRLSYSQLQNGKRKEAIQHLRTAHILFPNENYNKILEQLER